MPLGLPGLGRQLEVEQCPPFFLPHPAWPSCGVGGIVGRRVLLPVGWMGVHSRRLPPRVNSPAPWPPGRARVAPGPSGRVPRGARLRNGHHRVGEKHTVSCVWLAQDLARCGVVMGGDGLSGHPSDVGGGFPSRRSLGPVLSFLSRLQSECLSQWPAWECPSAGGAGFSNPDSERRPVGGTWGARPHLWKFPRAAHLFKTTHGHGHLLGSWLSPPSPRDPGFSYFSVSGL